MNSTESPEKSDASSPPSLQFPPWRDVLAALFCAFYGLTLILLPHLLWWPKLGEPTYIADHDDLLYLSITSQAYFNHPTYLSDPALVEGGKTHFPDFQFVPAILIAKALNLGPTGIDLVLRIAGGMGLGLGFYFLIRQRVLAPWLAAAFTVFMISDVGIIPGRPLINQAITTIRLLTGHSGDLLEKTPHICYILRILSPALSLPFFLLHIGLLFRARANPTWGRLILSGIGFGLLFPTYFYYWTTAGLALVLALILDAGHRRVYLHTGWIGGLIGLPTLIHGFLLKQSTPPDWLHRTDHFLPIAHFSELLIPKGPLLLAFVGFFWVLLRRRDLLYLWSICAAGVLLENHQVVTGLQIQNFHWFYVWGPTVPLLYVLLFVGAVPERHRSSWLFVSVVLTVISLDAAAGVYLRVQESLSTESTRKIHSDFLHYRAQRLDPEAPQLVPNAVVAGDQDFIDLAIVLENQRPLEHYVLRFSPNVRNEELDERLALNAYLQGVDRSTFAATQERDLDLIARWDVQWGPWSRNPTLRAKRVAHQIAAFDAITSNPAAALRRFHVRYVALPVGHKPPGSPDITWKPFQNGPSWTIWEFPSNRSSGD